MYRTGPETGMRNTIGIPEDGFLWEAASKGDMRAFDELYRRYWQLLLNEAYRALKVREEAEDVVQNLFVEVYGRMGTVQLTDVRAYLIKATRYAVYQRIRKYIADRKQHERLVELNIIKEGEEPFLESDYETLERLLADAIARLPEKCREVFLLSREEKLSYAEIATKLAISERTVEKHISKALKFLKSFLSATYGYSLASLLLILW